MAADDIEVIHMTAATGDLRERLTETLNTTVVTPEGGIERSTSRFDRHDRHNFLHNCAVCQGNVPAIVSTVLAALPGDPGDLPARMVEDDMDLRDLIGPRLEAAQVRDADGVAALIVDVISPALERLRADVRAAYAERDEMWERKAAALRERDEARRELAEAQASVDLWKDGVTAAGQVAERLRAERDALTTAIGEVLSDPIMHSPLGEPLVRVEDVRAALNAPAPTTRTETP